MTDEKRSNAGHSTGPPTEHVPHPNTASQGKDRYLVLRAQDGDIDAFGKLVERYQGRLFRTAYMIVRNRHDSEDIVQETLGSGVAESSSASGILMPSGVGSCASVRIRPPAAFVSASAGH